VTAATDVDTVSYQAGDSGQRMVVYFSAIVFLILTGYSIWHLTEYRRSALAAAGRMVMTHTLALREQAVRAIEEADLLLELIDESVEDLIRTGRLATTQGQRVVARHAGRLPHLSHLTLVDDKGRHLGGTWLPSVGNQGRPTSWIAQKSPGHAQTGFPFAEFNVVPEVYVGAGQMRPGLLLSHPFHDGSGTFVGGVQAMLDPAYFTGIADQLEFGPGSAILIAHDTGIVLMRSPENEAIGGSFADRPLFTHYLREAAAGTYRSPTQSDGRRRIVGFARLDPYPLVVAVGLDEQEVLKDWGAQVWAHGVLLVVVLVICGGVTRLVQRHNMRQAKGDAFLRRVAQQQQTLSILSQTALISVDRLDYLRMTARLVANALAMAHVEIVTLDDAGRPRWMATSEGGLGHDGSADDGDVPFYAFLSHATRPFRLHEMEQADVPMPRHLATLGVRHGLWSPVHLSERCYGVIGVYGTTDQPVQEADAHFLQSAAYAVSMFIERQRETRIREAVLDSLSANICLLSERGDIQMINAAWRDYAAGGGMAAAGYGVGMNYLAVCRAATGDAATDAGRMEQGIRGVLNGSADSFRHQYSFTVGVDELWYEALVSPVAFEHERGAVVMHVDVTERQRLEARRRSIQRMEALGQLTGGVAHDFNNLLTVVLGNAEMLEDDVHGNAEAVQTVRAIQSAAERGAELTNRLLAFGRRLSLEPKAFDINHLVHDVERLLRRVLDEDLVLTVDVTETLPAVVADPGQLQTALLNLVFNARDAMASGGSIIIRTKHVVLDAAVLRDNPEITVAEQVAVTVTDTGTGMPPEVMAKVYEPFFTTKPMGQNTGLGLSMVFGFVKQSGGHIWMDSEVGRGTVVSLCLPCAGSSAPVRSEPNARRVTPDGTGESVLVVEDDDLVRGLVAAALTSYGYRILSAASGPEALQRVRDQGSSIHLLLTDVVMPGGLNGRQLAEAVRQEVPGMPILFMTGYVQDKGAVYDMSDVLIDIIGKPFSPADLARRVRSLLDKRGYRGCIPDGAEQAVGDDRE